MGKMSKIWVRNLLFFSFVSVGGFSHADSLLVTSRGLTGMDGSNVDGGKDSVVIRSCLPIHRMDGKNRHKRYN